MKTQPRTLRHDVGRWKRPYTSAYTSPMLALDTSRKQNASAEQQRRQRRRSARSTLSSIGPGGPTRPLPMCHHDGDQHPQKRTGSRQLRPHVLLRPPTQRSWPRVGRPTQTVGLKVDVGRPVHSRHA